jgi:hypothetical protein
MNLIMSDGSSSFGSAGRLDQQGEAELIQPFDIHQPPRNIERNDDDQPISEFSTSFRTPILLYYHRIAHTSD